MLGISKSEDFSTENSVFFMEVPIFFYITMYVYGKPKFFYGELMFTLLFYVPLRRLLQYTIQCFRSYFVWEATMALYVTYNGGDNKKTSIRQPEARKVKHT